MYKIETPKEETVTPVNPAYTSEVFKEAAELEVSSK